MVVTIGGCSDVCVWGDATLQREQVWCGCTRQRRVVSHNPRPHRTGVNTWYSCVAWHKQHSGKHRPKFVMLFGRVAGRAHRA